MILKRNSNTMVMIKSAQLNTPSLSSIVGNQATSSPAMCPHKKPGSAQVGVGETTGTNQMIKIIQLIVELLTSIFGGKNEAGSTQQVPGSSATPGTPGTTTASEGQSTKGSSFLDKLGEGVLAFFSSAFGKLLG